MHVWNVPTVHMFHTLAHLKNAVGAGTLESPLRLRIERQLLEALDNIIAANPDERAEMVWQLGADNARICTIPPGIDLDLFQPVDAGQARARLGLPANP